MGLGKRWTEMRSHTVFNEIYPFPVWKRRLRRVEQGPRRLRLGGVDAQALQQAVDHGVGDGRGQLDPRLGWSHLRRDEQTGPNKLARIRAHVQRDLFFFAAKRGARGCKGIL